MASSSFNSSSSPSKKYDAFLSFRGADTRNKFSAHLRDALWEEKIKIFIDDENMEIGEYISAQLIQAIEDSRCSIIIISPQYASSKWCLIELVKILDCMEKMGQIVIPIFYHVKRCDVENQSGEFGKAFQRRIERDSEVELAASWRDALAKVAKLAGHELQPNGDEAQFVKEIVGEVSSKLKNVTSLNVSDDFSLLNSRVGVAGLISYLSTWLAVVDNFSVGILSPTLQSSITPQPSSMGYRGVCRLDVDNSALTRRRFC